MYSTRLGGRLPTALTGQVYSAIVDVRKAADSDVALGRVQSTLAMRPIACTDVHEMRHARNLIICPYWYELLMNDGMRDNGISIESGLARSIALR